MNNLVLQQEMTPSTWQMLATIAETSTTSQVERQKIARHLLFCYENRLPLSLAVNGGLYTVNNRVEVEAVVIRAQIKKHPNYDYKITRLENDGCTIEIYGISAMGILRERIEKELIGECSFNETDAKLAGLLDKGNWKNYPTDMYLARATSRAYKRFCPDIFFQSVYVRGEISEQPIVIEQHSVQSLIDEYGNEAVLDAMQLCDSDIDAMVEYLREVE